ncbi:MAG: CDP-diacylglycerol--glycerol-3-phosphate 3-phosphatidyltransferase [Bacteriovoracaceae bacterium]|nr:CDP-diacylglycerol--glycerol-3-phosphate 3-phosphatidyltransferase [Bacteriovoracaceae bacterium]
MLNLAVFKQLPGKDQMSQNNLDEEITQETIDSDDKVQEWEIDNLPNRITIFRICLIPIIILSLALNLVESEAIAIHHKTLGYIAAWTFVVAAITDFLDGHIARKRKIVTVFGSFLDPIADKFLVVSALILLQDLNRIPVLLVIILVLREIYITALRLLATEKNLSVPVGWLGKLKATFQMVAIPFLMANDTPWGIPMALLGTILIDIAAFLSVYSAVEYSVKLFKKFKIKRQMLKENTN